MIDVSVPRLSGLGELAPRYRALFCDVWGVVHNGVEADRDTVEALSRFRGDYGGAVVLITNAPRPHPSIVAQLLALGVPQEAFDAVVSSGDVTRGLIETAAADGERALHIGPERDLPLFEGIDIEFVGEDEASVLICTGLLDDETETPSDYAAAFERLADREIPMICANPDIVVERAGKLVYCAGALAEAFESLGGRTVLAGKPHGPIYDAAFERIDAVAGFRPSAAETLAIGDGLKTDIRGATIQGIDALFVTDGIHADELGTAGAPDAKLVTRRLDAEGLDVIGYVPRLVW